MCESPTLAAQGFAELFWEGKWQPDRKSPSTAAMVPELRIEPQAFPLRLPFPPK
jgi:hypothetical protein